MMRPAIRPSISAAIAAPRASAAPCTDAAVPSVSHSRSEAAAAPASDAAGSAIAIGEVRAEVTSDDLRGRVPGADVGDRRGEPGVAELGLEEPLLVAGHQDAADQRLERLRRDRRAGAGR